MNSVQPIGTDLAGVLSAGRKQLSDPAAAQWLAPLRAKAADAFAALPLPDRRQEAWRYGPPGFLQRERYAYRPAQAFEALQDSDIEHLLLADGATERVVFVNGTLAPRFCSDAINRGQLLVRSLGGALGEIPDVLRERLDSLVAERHLFTALNGALMSDGALIHVPRGVVSDDRTIELLHISVGQDEPVIQHPRHLIVVDDNASARIIERYAAVGDGVYFNNALVEVSVGAGSTLRHYRSQEESVSAQHLSDLHVRLERDSRYHLHQASLGANWARSDLRIRFAGQGGEARLNGLSLARDGQLNDIHLDIAHEVPHCTSQSDFKGILDGKGRAIFDGRILVAKDAQQTDARLSNDNLMLSRSAEVDTKPQLEIFADDVKCAHGATVGELDANMLFYLQSRGIPAAQARQMLSLGFAAEIVERVDHAALRERVERLLAERLLQRAAAQGPSGGGT